MKLSYAKDKMYMFTALCLLGSWLVLHLYHVSINMVSTENGLNAWLRYAPLPIEVRSSCKPYSKIIALNNIESSPVYVAGNELRDGIKKILGQEIEVTFTLSEIASNIIVGTVDSFVSAGGEVQDIPKLKEDGFWLCIKDNTVQILGQNERGALYGTFEYLSMMAQGNLSKVAYASSPSSPIRWVNEWDNLDGSIERGYAGPSFFFKDGEVMDDLTRAAQYGRLLASIRLNGIVVNNVNAHCSLLNSSI
jgi:alpha-glucuronidase